MTEIKIDSHDEIEIKLEPQEETEENSFGILRNDPCIILPIPFKEEPDVFNKVSTEIFLNDVCAAVKANIAEISEDLIDSDDKQLKDVEKQMEALQKVLATGKMKIPFSPNRNLRKESENKPTTSKIKSDISIIDSYDSEFDIDDEIIKCIVCKRVFNDQLSLEDHISKRNAVTACCACGKSFRDNSQLNIHHRKHTGEKPYSCKECKRQFSIKGNLHKHMRTHTGDRRFECTICQKRFFQFAHLDDHFKTHTGERPFNCDECHSAFKTKSLLKKHKKSHDESDLRKRYVRCRVCLKVMKTSKQLYGHMRTHSEDKEPFKCEVCGKIYKSLFYLQGHQRMHEGIKPYKCSVCEKSFHMSSQLRRHENTHAGLKPFICQICSRAFGVIQNLKRHLLTHSGDKPFACEICGKAFLTCENMQRHTRIHTGEKPFSCDICGRKFAHSTTVKEHRRTHTGDKPFGCSICNKRFSMSKILFKHMRGTHQELNATFQKVQDIPIEVRSQVAHNFDKDEYQEPEYIKTADLSSDLVKEEQDEDNKPLIYLMSHSKKISLRDIYDFSSRNSSSLGNDEDKKPLVKIEDSFS